MKFLSLILAFCVYPSAARVLPLIKKMTAINEELVLDHHDQTRAAKIFADPSKTKAEKLDLYYQEVYLPRRLRHEPSRQEARQFMSQLKIQFGSEILLVQPNRIKIPRAFEGSVFALIVLANMQEQRLFHYLGKSTLPLLFLPYLRHLRLAHEWEILRFVPQEYLDHELQTLPEALAYDIDRNLVRSILGGPRSSRDLYVEYQISHGRSRTPKRIKVVGCALLSAGAFAMYNWLM